MTNQPLFNYLLRLGDNALILGQRLGEWCGHGPILEQDIAITNIALDMVGQARMWLTYAGEVEGKGRDEDALAFHRDVGQYANLLLLEQENGDFAHTIVRQFLFDSFNYFFHEALMESRDERVKAIAQKSLKEITYHLRYSSEWVIRLGDGTNLSHEKMTTAVQTLYPYADEALKPDDLDQKMYEEGIAPNLSILWDKVQQKRQAIFSEAKLSIPERIYQHIGGKTGQHTEHLGFILTELQWLQRTHPGATW